MSSPATEIETGWPIDIASRVGVPNIPALADLNHDGRPEVLISSFGTYLLHAFRGDGTELPGWPKETGEYFPLPGSPVVGRVQAGDGESVVYRAETSGRIKVVSPDGTEIPGLQKRFSYGYLMMPVIKDIDQDGRNELVAVDEDGMLFVWDTEGDSCMNSSWSTWAGDESHSGVFSTSASAQFKFGCGATLELKLVDSKGAPVAGTRVDGGVLGKRVSDARGIVRFGGLPLGISYSLALTSPSHTFHSVNGTVKGDESLMVSGEERLFEVRGRVVTASSQPIAGAVISAGICGQAVSGEDGSFSITGVAYNSSCSLKVEKVGFRFTSPAALSILSGDNFIEIVGAQKHVTVRGLVRGTARPLSGATVTLDNRTVVRTGADGRFVVRHVLAGETVRFRISAPGYLPRKITTAFGEDNRITVKLRARM